jgi:hypothetical protein
MTCDKCGDVLKVKLQKYDASAHHPIDEPASDEVVFQKNNKLMELHMVPGEMLQAVKTGFKGTEIKLTREFPDDKIGDRKVRRITLHIFADVVIELW